MAENSLRAGPVSPSQGGWVKQELLANRAIVSCHLSVLLKTVCEFLNSDLGLYGLACSSFGGHLLQISTQAPLTERVKKI